MAGLREDRALEILRKELRSSTRHVALGIGDDCAILRPSTGPSAWSIDANIEGVHFDLAWMSHADVAHRSLAAAVSDLAAMGATPTGALAQVTLSPGLTAAQLRSFAQSQARAARLFGCPIIGGNLTQGDRFEVVTTVLGSLGKKRPLLRTGARPGDELWLVGSVGRARAGYLSLARGLRLGRGMTPCLEAFRRPLPLLEQGRSLVDCARACLDVSDGLARDAATLASSSGVRVTIDEALLLPLEPLVERAARKLGESAADLMLQGGEDYALLATGPARRRPPWAHVIGRIEAGRGAFALQEGKRVPLSGGYQHEALQSASGNRSAPREPRRP